MSRTLLLLLAVGCSVAGMAWLALAMDAHWRQVRGAVAARRAVVLGLRLAGALALAVSLLLCLRADHPTMAALVWVMSLAVGGLCVAFALAWRPRALAPLVGWLR
jgi:hypothetical protein